MGETRLMYHDLCPEMTVKNRKCQGIGMTVCLTPSLVLQHGIWNVIWHMAVEEERPDDDKITTQCDATTVHEGTNANTENAATSEPTGEYSTSEDTDTNTWAEAVKQRTKKTNER